MSDSQTSPASPPEPRIALRIRARDFLGKILLNGLTAAGRPATPAYLAASEKLINHEVNRIRQLDIGTSSYYGLLSLYPDLQRTFFVHIPKCGGTSIRQSLVDEFECAPVPLPGEGATRQAIDYMVRSVAAGTPQGALLATCSGNDEDELALRYLNTFTAYRLTRSPQRAFILGHKIAREIMPFYRADKDMLFSTVRDPGDALKSMVAYQVFHTLANKNRVDSREFLASLQMDYAEFEELITSNPRRLTERAIEGNAQSLTHFLSSDSRTDCESVWQGIRDNRIFVAHMSEQYDMLEKLFSTKPKRRRKNSSGNQQGPAAKFYAALQRDWVEPYVEPESRSLYQRIESAGIIGFWKNGGTKNSYIDLVK